MTEGIILNNCCRGKQVFHFLWVTFPLMTSCNHKIDIVTHDPIFSPFNRLYDSMIEIATYLLLYVGQGHLGHSFSKGLESVMNLCSYNKNLHYNLCNSKMLLLSTFTCMHIFFHNNSHPLLRILSWTINSYE